MNELKKRIQQCSPRERWLISGCIVLLIISLGYYTLWHPWQLREEKWVNIILREKSTVEWMKQQIPRIQAKKGGEQVKESVNLSSTVVSSSSSYALTITRLQPQGEQLIVTLEPCEFNSLMQWLIDLESEYHIHVFIFDVTAQDNNPGWVVINRLVLTKKE